MIMLVAFAVAVLSVLLAGGRLERVASLELRQVWWLYTALGLQVAVIEVLPASFPLGNEVHLASYAMAALFLIANRSLPGMFVIAAGAAANVTAIAANGGVMPASADAVRRAGLDDGGDHFLNSAAIAQPRVGFLGDIFAIPEGYPFANVFSIGDVLLAVGGAAALHIACGSTLARRLRGNGRPGHWTAVSEASGRHGAQMARSRPSQ